MFSPTLLQAAAHLRWLLEREYPPAASLKLVGDRHRLTREDRQVLQRGVSAPAVAERRRTLLLAEPDLAGRSLAVDGHNVVLTVANYMAGVRVFVADDGLVRDIGILHGRLHDGPLMTRALDLVAYAIPGLRLGLTHIVFDAPISHSRDHAAWLRGRLGADGPITVEVVRSGDRAVRDSPAEVIATSDSALIDAAGRPVFDLARLVLEQAFHPDLDSFPGFADA